MTTYIDKQGNIVCSLHMDASVMNKHDECDECLDDAHEAEILHDDQVSNAHNSTATRHH